MKNSSTLFKDLPTFLMHDTNTLLSKLYQEYFHNKTFLCWTSKRFEVQMI